MILGTTKTRVFWTSSSDTYPFVIFTEDWETNFFFFVFVLSLFCFLFDSCLVLQGVQSKIVLRNRVIIERRDFDLKREIYL